MLCTKCAIMAVQWNCVVIQYPEACLTITKVEGYFQRKPLNLLNWRRNTDACFETETANPTAESCTGYWTMEQVRGRTRILSNYRLLAKGVFADDCRSLRSNWCDRKSGQLRDPPRLRRDRGLPNSSTRISAIAVRRQSYETRWERESDTLIEKKKHEHVQKVIKLEPKAAAVPNTATHAYRDRVPCQSSPGSVGRDTSLRLRNSANLVPAFLPICSVSVNTIQAIYSWRGHKRRWNRQRFSRFLVDQYGKRE